MSNTILTATSEKVLFSQTDVEELMHRFHYSDETKAIIREEDLLPTGVLSRLHATFPQHSGMREKEEFHFNEIGRASWWETVYI